MAVYGQCWVGKGGLGEKMGSSLFWRIGGRTISWRGLVFHDVASSLRRFTAWSGRIREIEVLTIRIVSGSRCRGW